MAISVAQLIDASKGVADKRNDPTISDPDWTRYVNWGVQSLDRFIASLDPGFRFAQADFTLTATPTGARRNLRTATWTDIDGVALLGTYKALHGIDKDPDQPQRRTIRRGSFRQRNRGSVGWWYPTNYAPDLWYDERGQTAVVSPYERAAGSYRAYARLGPRLFTSEIDATPLDFQLEPYDEYITDMAARRGLGIEESDTSFNSGRLAEMKVEIQAEFSRDDGEAPVISDVEEDDPEIDGY